ncbi:MAG TPA: transposase [Candidatus Deferrimicrobium sp.]|nr:transposase [Candidatus Deferrimicrobium sp.]
MDATTTRVDLDQDRVNQPESANSEARFGRFPFGRKLPGYNQQAVVDDTAWVILAVDVTRANVNEGSQLVFVLDDALKHLGQRPDAVCAELAYASGENAAACEQAGVHLISPPRAARNHHGGTQFTIEEFAYDEPRDIFICPNDKVLVKVHRFRGNEKRFKYRAFSRGLKSKVLQQALSQE